MKILLALYPNNELLKEFNPLAFAQLKYVIAPIDNIIGQEFTEVQFRRLIEFLSYRLLVLFGDSLQVKASFVLASHEALTDVGV